MKKSFTLIELLIVIVIIGILSALAIPQYDKIKEKAINAEAMQMLGAIRRSEMTYKSINGHYVDILNGCSSNQQSSIPFDVILEPGCPAATGYVSPVPHTVCMDAIGMKDPNFPPSKYWVYDGDNVGITAFRKHPDGTADGSSRKIYMDYDTGEITPS